MMIEDHLIDLTTPVEQRRTAVLARRFNSSEAVARIIAGLAFGEYHHDRLGSWQHLGAVAERVVIEAGLRAGLVSR